MPDNTDILTMTVNEVIQRYPRTVTVFDRYGIDSCCGGGLVVSVAAERHGIDVRALREELTQVVGQAA